MPSLQQNFELVTDPRLDAGQDRMPRTIVLLSAKVEGFPHGATTIHRVRDLSTTGARIDGALTLVRGSTVLISIGSLKAVAATIIWVADGDAGLRFAHVIDADQARAKAFIGPKATAVKR